MSTYIKTIGGQKLTSDYNTEGKKLLTATDIENKQDKLTAGSNVSISDDNIISSDQVFIVHYGAASYDDIKAAIDANKVVICVNTNNTYGFVYAVTDSNIRFSCVNAVAGTNLAWLVSTANVWTTSTINVQSKLTFDTVPTLDSTNPVTSKGIKTAIDAVLPTLPTTGTSVLKCVNGVLQWVSE